MKLQGLDITDSGVCSFATAAESEGVNPEAHLMFPHQDRTRKGQQLLDVSSCVPGPLPALWFSLVLSWRWFLSHRPMEFLLKSLYSSSSMSVMQQTMKESSENFCRGNVSELKQKLKV